MNGTLSFRDKLCALFENALAWFVESGVMGAIFVLWILAAILGIFR